MLAEDLWVGAIEMGPVAGQTWTSSSRASKPALRRTARPGRNPDDDHAAGRRGCPFIGYIRALLATGTSRLRNLDRTMSKPSCLSTRSTTRGRKGIRLRGNSSQRLVR